MIDEWKEGGNSENHESVVTRQFLTECPINAHHLGIFAGKNTRQFAVGDMLNYVASSSNNPHTAHLLLFQQSKRTATPGRCQLP